MQAEQWGASPMRLRKEMGSLGVCHWQKFHHCFSKFREPDGRYCWKKTKRGITMASSICTRPKRSSKGVHCQQAQRFTMQHLGSPLDALCNFTSESTACRPGLFKEKLCSHLLGRYPKEFHTNIFHTQLHCLQALPTLASFTLYVSGAVSRPM